MRLLLDTHVLLWWLDDNPVLSPDARTAIAEPENAGDLRGAEVNRRDAKNAEQSKGSAVAPPYGFAVRSGRKEHVCVRAPNGNGESAGPPHQRSASAKERED